MFKLIATFLIAGLGMTVMNAVVATGGGIVATLLTANISATALVIPVVSTEGYLNLDTVTIDGESIYYTSKDTTNLYVDVAGRGAGGTTAAAHKGPMANSYGALVYSDGANTINQLATYNISQITSATGTFSFLNFVPALVNLLLHAVTINFAFLGTDLAILTYIWGAMTAAFWATLAIYLLSSRSAIG